MQYLGLGESQTGIKICKKNTNNIRYTDDAIIMAETKDELKSLLTFFIFFFLFSFLVVFVIH